MFEQSLPTIHAALPQVITGGATPIGELLSELLAQYHLGDNDDAPSNPSLLSAQEWVLCEAAAT